MILGTGVEGYIACASAFATWRRPRCSSGSRRRPSSSTGRQDPACTVDQATVLHRMIDGSQLVILEDAAHLSNIEQPQAFNAALRAFIDRVDDDLPAVR